MARLISIKLDCSEKDAVAVIAEWDNGRRQRIEFEDLTPFYVERALWLLQNTIHKDECGGNI